MIKRELIFMLYVSVALTPMMVFLVAVLDINLLNDYGLWELVGFVACLIFYKEVAQKAKQ